MEHQLCMSFVVTMTRFGQVEFGHDLPQRLWQAWQTQTNRFSDSCPVLQVLNMKLVAVQITGIMSVIVWMTML